MEILLIEDDSSIIMGLSFALKQEGFQVQSVGTVKEAKALLNQKTFDLLLLDVGLPDGDGYEVCQFLKSSNATQTPVIFLTACDAEVNIVMGLELGADDYITKPFGIRELIARIKSVLRRSGKTQAQPSSLTFGNVSLDLAKAKVYKHSKEVLLTALEYRLFLIPVHHKNQVLSRVQLLDSIWDVAGDFVNDNTLTVYIKRLREKLEDNPQKPTLIQTVRGLGYKLEVKE